MVKWKKVAVFVLSFFVLAGCFLLSACNKDYTYRAEFAQKSLTLNIEQSATLEIMAYRNDVILSKAEIGEYSLVWSSDRPEIASVNGGTVTALAAGKANVSVKEKNDLFAASIEVNVSQKGVIGITSVALKNRNIVKFDCDIAGAIVYIGDAQYQSTIVGANEIAIENVDYMKAVSLRIEKYGYENFATTFMYTGYMVDNFDGLKAALISSVSGDVIIMSTEIIVPENKTITIPKNVILKTGDFTIGNFGEIIIIGTLDGVWAGTEPIKGETIPEDGVN